MSRELSAFLTLARRRIAVVAGVEGAIIGLGVASALVLLGWPGRGATLTPLASGALAALVGVVARVWLARREPRVVALAVERRVPRSKNLIVTAVELADGSAKAGAYAASAVAERASRLVGELEAAALFPLGQRRIVLPLALAAWFGALAIATRGEMLGRVASDVPTIDRVDVVITPPAYTGRAATSERNPDRVRALAGSRIEFRTRTNATMISVATADSSRTVEAARGEASFALVPRSDGFVTLTAGVSGGERRTIGISVDIDAAPLVQISAPGRDLVVPDGKRALDIAIEASDDIGLASLTLRYTKVSGSGERFTFKDADIPLAVARRNATAWTASRRWVLDSLGLVPGDMLVYRAIVSDNRPGSTPIESDAFIVDITTAGGVAEAGYSVDPDEERTALSQQMVVLKTQRLLAEKARHAADALVEKSQEIAAEQRRVRAEFVFLMGGEMSDAGANDTLLTDIDETADAAAEEDLMAGRQLNQGRIALLRAIRAMSLASRSLNEADLTTALTHEREAVKQLELAFSRNRILLRAFSQREALDTTRRLSGEMSDLARGTRTGLVPEPSMRAARLREIIEYIHRGELRTAAEWVLRFEPGLRPMQQVSADLSAAATARESGREADARAAIDRATTILHSVIGAELPVQRSTPGALEQRLLRGAANDARRGRRP